MIAKMIDVNGKEMVVKAYPGCDHKWDNCVNRFTCGCGEDCWFESDDYKKEMNSV